MSLIWVILNMSALAQVEMRFEKCDDTWYQFIDDHDYSTNLRFYSGNVVVKISYYTINFWGSKWYELKAGFYQQKGDSLYMEYDWRMTIDSICAFEKAHSSYLHAFSEYFDDERVEVYSVEDTCLTFTIPKEKRNWLAKKQYTNSRSGIVKNATNLIDSRSLESLSDSLLVSIDDGYFNVYEDLYNPTMVKITYSDRSVWIKDVLLDSAICRIGEGKILKGQPIGYLSVRERKQRLTRNEYKKICLNFASQAKYSMFSRRLTSSSDSLLLSPEEGYFVSNDSTELEIYYPDYLIHFYDIRIEDSLLEKLEGDILPGQPIGYLPKRNRKFKGRMKIEEHK